MQPALTIVGSSARAAAQSAVGSGFFVRAADLFADLDLRCIADATRVEDYPTELGRVIAEPREGGWLYTGAIENHPELVDRWARIRPLLGNPGAVLRSARNPRLIASVLSRCGLPAIPTVDDPDTLPVDGSWMAKPWSSAGGIGVHPWLGGEHASRHEFYYQQRVAGENYSGVYVANGSDAALLGVTEQLLGKRWGAATDFRYCGSIAPISVGPEIRQQFAAIGQAFAAEFGLRGLFGVDAIVNDHGVWTVEINPRYTASMELVERVSAIPMIQCHVAACQQGVLPAHCTAADELGGKLIVYAGRKFIWSEVNAARWIEDATGLRPLLADIPPAGTQIDAGWPVATVFAFETTRDAVIERLLSRSKLLLASCDDA